MQFKDEVVDYTMDYRGVRLLRLWELHERSLLRMGFHFGLGLVS